jgi:hypothetical protein
MSGSLGGIVVTVDGIGFADRLGKKFQPSLLDIDRLRLRRASDVLLLVNHSPTFLAIFNGAFRSAETSRHPPSAMECRAPRTWRADVQEWLKSVHGFG